MPTSYNTVLGTYRGQFGSLPFRAQFHFASRVYLWNQPVFAEDWLAALRPVFTAQDSPDRILGEIATQPLPPMSATAHLREAYFDRYPDLRKYERLLFRTLFLQTVYGLDARPALLDIISVASLHQLRDRLRSDEQALAYLSSFAVNFLYLFRGLFEPGAEPLHPLELLEQAAPRLELGDALQRQLYGYFITHCIIGESLFYARPIDETKKPEYLQLLKRLETLIMADFSGYKLDVLYEFLVGCRLLGYSSPLDPAIQELTADNLSGGFITEPGKPRGTQTLRTAEHRNVLYLMSQVPFGGTARI